MKLRVKRHAVVQPLDTSYRLIPLTQGQTAIVDEEDFDWLSQWNWLAQWSEKTKSFYAQHHRNPVMSMHRLILGCSESEEGDHKDHNTLNNRRNNLRKCTGSQNCSNRRIRADNVSGFKGVYWKVEREKWVAQIKTGGVCRWLGYFDTAQEAAEVYDTAAK